jgi:hypothetical protein
VFCLRHRKLHVTNEAYSNFIQRREKLCIKCKSSVSTGKSVARTLEILKTQEAEAFVWSVKLFVLCTKIRMFIYGRIISCVNVDWMHLFMIGTSGALLWTRSQLAEGLFTIPCTCCHDTSVVQRCATAGWSGDRVPVAAGNFYLHHRVQIGSGAHAVRAYCGSGGTAPRILWPRH